MLMVLQVVLNHRHLSTANTRTNIRHAVVVSDSLMLVVRIGLTSLCSQPHHLLPSLIVRADECTATTGRNHLIAIKRQHAILTKRAQHLSFVARAKTLSRILYNGNIITIGYF